MQTIIETQTFKQIKSPLNYIGGKYKLLEQILHLFPKEINTFVDWFRNLQRISMITDFRKFASKKYKACLV
ncbi:MAG: DNA adenine methylase [Thermoflexibacteraceae bacterium]